MSNNKPNQPNQQNQQGQSNQLLPRVNLTLPKWVIPTAIIVIAFFVLMSFLRSFWYFDVVQNDQVGVKIEAGQIIGVEQPGVAYDFGLFVELVKITTSSVPVTVDDPELITLDKQRIGLEVTADVFRPREPDIVISNFSRYKNIYTNDTYLTQRITAFTLQAMKVCVGDKKFDDAVIGSGRDALRTCIDKELSALAEPLGLEVRNVAVPQVTISPEVQAGLDAIVQSRLATEKAKQDAEKAKQEAAAQQAVEEGSIRVQQSKLQEEARQQAVLQDLKKKQLEAELAVIQQETVNAQAQLELTQAQQRIADEQAQVDIAKELALAKMYAQYPEYVALQIALANANAVKDTDKFVYTPSGVFPNFIITTGAVPTIPLR